MLSSKGLDVEVFFLGHHKTNGIYGALVVRRPTANDPNKVLYDEDLPEHVIIISDTMQYVADMYDPGLRQDPRGITPDNIVINGRGMRRGVSSFAEVSD